QNLDLNRDKYALFYPTQNRAVLIKNKYQASLEEVSLPKMKPGDILIQVNYVGVCRTDLEIYDGSLGYYHSGLAHYPIVPGHEFSGKIIQIGANNKYREWFKVGERVVGECILSRGPGRQEVGVINYNGAYSQFMIMPGEYLHQIPEGLDSKIACLAEPLAVVLRAIKRLSPRLKLEDSIAVVGVGAIGNLCSQVLSRLGYQITVFDKNKDRIEFLRDKVKEVSRALDNLEKFNVIIEATGSVEVLGKILKASRPDATVLLLGFPYGNIDYNFEDIVSQEKVVIGSVGGSAEEFREALQLLPELDTRRFTENILPLAEFTKAWQLHNSQKYLKIILEVG
ncbi:MAG: alcohol dehydrogenase catalytic domain-containing protein, partial [Patescibacteria group bacterium]